MLFIDIDECKISGIRCGQKCQNLEGSYECKCFPGYKLEADGFTCTGNSNSVKIDLKGTPIGF